MGTGGQLARRDGGDRRRNLGRTIYLDGASIAPDSIGGVIDAVVGAADGLGCLLVRVGADDDWRRIAAIAANQPQVRLLVEAALAEVEDLGGAAIPFPPGTTGNEVEDFGLALSDAVVRPAIDADGRLATRARLLGKPLLPADDPAGGEDDDPVEPDAATIARLRRLDPYSASAIRAVRRQASGRIDTWVIEGLAAVGKMIVHVERLFAPRPHPHQTARRHATRFLRAFRPWSSQSYFAPDAWLTLCPSDPAPDPAEQTVQAFDWLDRAALTGARHYRDLIWLAHFGAFFAVFASIAGTIWGNAWAPAELGTLVALLLIAWYLHASRLQHRWTACRIGAEQLRFARMSLPLLVVPQMLLTPDRRHEERGRVRHAHAVSEGAGEAAVALSLAKQAIRHDGPRAIRHDFTATGAARWMLCIVTDQRAYHERNHDTLGAVEATVSLVNLVVFIGIMALVIAHMFHLGPIWTILVTTAGPAGAAALHAAGSRLEIARRADLSESNAADLGDLETELAQIIENPSENDWQLVRDVARRAVQAMGSEADSWHSSMLLQPVTLP